MRISLIRVKKSGWKFTKQCISKNKNALCYEQTAPLDVPVYAFGNPKPAALAQFVHSARFFSSPKRSRNKKILNHPFATAPFFYFSIMSVSCTYSSEAYSIFVMHFSRITNKAHKSRQVLILYYIHQAFLGCS